MAPVQWRYKVTKAAGWRERNGKQWVTVSGRAGLVLPLLVEALRLRERFGLDSGVVLQVRKVVGKEGLTSLGTVVSLQNLPCGGERTGDFRPQLLAPATYAEVDFEVGKVNEIRVLRRLLPQKVDTAAIQVALDHARWSYDLVLWLRSVRVNVFKDGAELLADAEPMARTDDTSPLSIVRSPDYDGWQGLNIMEHTVIVPWLPENERFAVPPRSVMYLISGERAAAVLRSVVELWKSRTARNVLVCADPGSGKEVVSRLLHFGRGGRSLQALSVAGAEWTGMQSALLGQGQPGGPPIFEGFIEKSVGGTVFLDEIDKAGDCVRGGLLRILEGDQFHRPGSWELVDLQAHGRPLFVFAGSGNGPRGNSLREAIQKADRRLFTSNGRALGANQNAELGRPSGSGRTVVEICRDFGLDGPPDSVLDWIRVEHPSDFWQRMDQKIVFKHPLGDKEPEAWSYDALKRYVEWFMRSALESLSGHATGGTDADKMVRFAEEHFRTALRKDWAASVEEVATKIKDHRKGSRPGLREVRDFSTEFVRLSIDHLRRGSGPIDPSAIADAALELWRR